MHSTLYTLITGASSGMGEATAKLLSSSRNLILCGRDKDRLATVGEACISKGADVVLFPFDLEQADKVGAALKTLLKEKKLPVEAFVHFAGMTDLLPVSQLRYHVGLQVMNVNYFSATEIICILTKKNVNRENLKNIVLCSSIVTQTGIKCQSHYCGSKAALEGLSKGLAIELAPRVRVNVIAPGSFNTRIMHTIFKDSNGNWNPPTLLPVGTVEEIANVAHFLLSDDSKYLTGQRILVDGGEELRR